jgi:hypothetical protein
MGSKAFGSGFYLIEVLSRFLSKGTEKTMNPQPGYPVFWPGFDTVSSEYRSKALLLDQPARRELRNFSLHKALLGL